MKRMFAVCMALLLVWATLAGCASKSAMDQAASEPAYNTSSSVADSARGEFDVAAPTEAAEAPQGFVPAADHVEQEAVFGGEMGAKVIKSGYMTIETLEFDETTSAIIRRVQQQGGFIASSNIQGVSRNDAVYKPMRRAQFKLRIPSQRFEQFMTDVGELGNITQQENWGEDISGQYYDTEARVQALQVREERLLSILQKAERLQDILELERELSRVRYEIESHTGTLKKWDSQVAYSTLEINVQEVEEIKKVEVKPVTLWEKVTRGFKNSISSVAKILEFMLIFIISALPFLLLFGIIGCMVYVLVRLILKKKGS